MNIYISIFIFALALFVRAFAYDIFSNIKTYKDLKEELNNLPFEERLKLEIIESTLAKDEKKAKGLFSLLKILQATYKDNPVLENIIYVPENKYAIVVSKKRQNFKIITNKNGVIQQTYTQSCITGKRPGDKLKEGDKRTPSGIYFPMGFIPSNKLSDIYGHGAFPLNYPNIIDRMIFHKTGDGIWLHATNDDNRPPFSSNGCVVVKNNVFDNISKYISVKDTPVVIVNDYSFTSKDNLQKTKKEIVQFFYSWIKAWENSTKPQSLKKYFSFYSDNMISVYGNKKAFIKHKKAVSKRKKWIKIYVNDIYIAKDGRVLNFGNIYSVSFSMEYKSNNYNWKGKKVIYIIKEEGKWKILAEESL